MIPTWLRTELDKGSISFERFMALALFHPAHGYYTNGIQSVGRGGDFSTSTTLSATLAEAIASWIQSEVKERSLKRPYHFVELGPGDGSLMRGVLDFLPWTMRRFCHLHLVEVSKPLKELQGKKLHKHQKRTTWHTTLAEADKTLPAGSHPLIFSNEFFDAFPVRVFRDADELHLSVSDDRLAEEWLPALARPSSTVFGRKWGKGQRLEVAESAACWIHDNLAALPRGSLLTIDYGGSPQEIYHRKPGGTVRGYFLQQLLTGPDLYENPGLHDLTADVNFEDLVRLTEAEGLKTRDLLTQADFLAPFLDHSAAADRFLSDTMGAGEAFKVLIQSKS